MENNNNEQNGFSYTYSAKEQTELRKIREKYTSPTKTEDKMTRLRRLDASVTNMAQIVSLVLGVIGALVLGFGMSLCMTNVGSFIGLYQNAAFILGIILGIIGGIVAGFAYPAYNFVINRMRKRVAPEIIRLTDELLK
ncbi:MAG: hypothetical protein IKA74_07685 [Clostridia bacterium]|nr:hypothetical protein [Clostridia bacterium]